MLRLSARYEGKSWNFEVPPGVATLGSATVNELVLPVPGVSRRHIRIERQAEGLQLVDLGSKNGIRKNGRRHDRVDLLPGERVRIGRAQLQLEEVPSAETEMAIRLELPERSARRGSASRGSTTSGGATTSEISPTVALDLVRRLEKEGLAPDRSQTSLLLEEARRLLEADWMSLLATPAPRRAEGDGNETESALIVHAGPLPDAPAAPPLRTLLDGSSTPLFQRHGDHGFLVARAPDDGRALVAQRPGELPHPHPWQLDFFEFLAGRAFRGAPRPTLAAAHERPTPPALRLPEGFIAGSSPAMRNLLDYLRSTVRSPLDVLLLGETGTGKELMAHIVHDSGPAATGPFVAINCAAIPAELLEAELFGVEARVATGVDARPGLFVRADGGSLFLDEIGDMSEPMQAKLLRALQEREVLPVGGHRPRPVQVRVISASNKNLLELVGQGRFRADLYYRLRGLQFHLPPLRERPDDLPALVAAFVERASVTYAKRIRGVSRSALELLQRHAWPGNVRELRNEVERAVLIAEDCASLEPRHFGTVQWQVEHPGPPSPDPQAEAQPHGTGDAAPAGDGTLASRVDAVERRAIVEALARCRNNKSRAARQLGITRNGLAMKMKRLGLS